MKNSTVATSLFDVVAVTMIDSPALAPAGTCRESMTGAIESGVVNVVVTLSCACCALPAWSRTPETFTVYVVSPCSSSRVPPVSVGVKTTTVLPSIMSRWPLTGPDGPSTANEDSSTLVGSIASLNVTRTRLSSATFVAPSGGLIVRTVGDTSSIVTKLELTSTAKRVPTKSRTPPTIMPSWSTWPPLTTSTCWVSPASAPCGVNVAVVPSGDKATVMGTTLESSHGSLGSFSAASSPVDSNRSSDGGSLGASGEHAVSVAGSMRSENTTCNVVSTETAPDPFAGVTCITAGGSTSRVNTTVSRTVPEASSIRPLASMLPMNIARPSAVSTSTRSGTSSGIPTNSTDPTAPVSAIELLFPAVIVTSAPGIGSPSGSMTVTATVATSASSN